MRSTQIGILLILAALSARVQAVELGEELRQFTSIDAQIGDEFGWSTGIHRGIGIFGAPNAQNNGAASGAAFLFDVTTGEQLARLVPDDIGPGDRFGVSVAIYNDIAIVGSLLADAQGEDSGAAYLFDVNTGKQLHKLVGDSVTTRDEFGVSVDVYGTTAIVGAHKHNSGLAYLFDVTSGQQLGTLLSEDAAPGDLFGVAVSIDQGTALIGARYDDEFGTSAGSAYLFDVATQKQLHKLNSHDAYTGDRFGMYLDLEGNTAIVASRYDDDAKKSSGSAYLFDVTTGEERFKLTAADADPNDHFGSGVSLSGNIALIGAVNDETDAQLQGSAYLFDISSGEQLMKIIASDRLFLDQFGHSVAIDGGFGLVGAVQFTGLHTGKGYAFAIPETSVNLPLLLFAFLVCRGRGACSKK
ncbi:MAG: hypothetical protein KDB27_02395 [Planctomycetales bacterium]|nr:hypothetical protein [Planctomycetales bacterium]